MPVIFALRNALFLEQPSSFQRQFAKSAEEERLHITDLELNMLRQMEKRKLSDDKRGDSSDASVSQIQIINTNVKRNGSDVKDKVRFKRKKAKVRVLVKTNSLLSCETLHVNVHYLS